MDLGRSPTGREKPPRRRKPMRVSVAGLI